MDKEEIEDYINRLTDLESQLSGNEDDPTDGDFVEELNRLLNQLGTDIQSSSEVPSFNLKVKVKKLDPNAIIPSYSKDGDAGMDLTITREIENTSFSVSYGFGIAMEIPKGYVGLVFPRSSVRNQDLILSNCVGVIDSGYRGELQATFKKTNGLDSIKYKVGDRGAQIMIVPYPKIEFIETDDLSNTERGDGGFGSTGK
jgi:dUTP pyrophosphatase